MSIDVSTARACTAVEAQVGRDPVPLAEQDDVADHQLLGGDLDRHAVAHDGGPARQEVAEPLGGVLGALLLHEREHPVEHDDDEDGDAELGQAGDERQRARHPEQQGEEVDHLRGEPPPRRRAGRQGEQVRAVGREAGRGFVRGETAPGLVGGLDRGHTTAPSVTTRSARRAGRAGGDRRRPPTRRAGRAAGTRAGVAAPPPCRTGLAGAGRR